MEQHNESRSTTFRGFACSDDRRSRFESSGGRGGVRVVHDGNRRWIETTRTVGNWRRPECGVQDWEHWSSLNYRFNDHRVRENMNIIGNLQYRVPNYNRFDPRLMSERDHFRVKNDYNFHPQSSSSSSDSFDAASGSFKPHPLSRRGSAIYPLRTFNNWAKVKIIQRAVPDTLKESIIVMDLGCCKGVDLKKWAHCKVSHVYLVDEDEQDMEECRRRYIEINNRWPKRFKASFINKDYAYEEIRLPELVDLVSCQFLVQRAFSSRDEAATFAKNVSLALKPGGHFIVSLANADKIKSLLYQSKDRMRCSNGVFSVELESPLPDNCPEYGIKMLFRVDDKFFPENLVQMMTLQRIMEQENMDLVWRRTFPELYEEARTDEEQKKLLVTMGVVEGGKLLMSTPELETANLYEAAMFIKRETKKSLSSENTNTNTTAIKEIKVIKSGGICDTEMVTDTDSGSVFPEPTSVSQYKKDQITSLSETMEE